MVQNLKPVVELNSEDWTELLKKYKLQTVMSSVHVQVVWYRMQRALEPEIWYEVHGKEVLAAATLGEGIDQLLEKWSDKGQILTVMPQIVWQWRLFNVYMDCWKMNW